MVVGENKRTNIMDGIENTGDVRLHDHRLRLKQRFDIVRKLGQGTYGKVQLGINKKTGQEVAIKTIKKCKIESEADLVRIRREVQIMSSVRHPNIVHIYEVFENSEKMILVMEYCSGGELYDYLSQKKVLQEDEARRLFRQIATAVYYCHIHKICHRDLKLENVLVDDTGSAKIADFGLSNVFKETSLLSTFCGSPLYASPEIVKGTPYIGPEVDCWSLGVLLYTLVYGAMPFDGSNFKRLVRQISNGDYYEPKNPSTASPLIRDMLTVDPLKRADITYICDHPWVNTGYSESCLEVAEALAAQTPVRLDLLLSLAPAAPSHSNSVLVPSAPSTQENDLGPEESGTDLTNSASMAVEPSNSAEKRILELVAEGGEDAIKPSPTRTIVSAGDNKRKLEIAMSASGLQRKKEKVGSCANIGPQAAVPEEPVADIPTPEDNTPREQSSPLCLKSSATITIQPAVATVPAPPPPLVKDTTREIKHTQTQKEKDTPKESPPKEEDREKTGAKPQEKSQVKKKVSVTKPADEKAPEKVDETKDEAKPSSVASAADKLTSLTLSQPTTNQTPKPKKLSIPGGNVGSFKEQFERRASLTSAPEVKRNVTKPVSKIAKPKAQSEDRELSSKASDNGSVRLQQIGIEPSPAPQEEGSRGGVKKTESEPAHSSAPVDPSVLLQDARRSLQNSMAKLVEERAGEDRRRAARDIISTAIRTGKPPVPYGRSSSAGVASLASPPGTPPAAPAAPAAPRVYRTEAQHKVEDHRNRGVSVERIIPINLPSEETPSSPPPKSAAQPAVRPVQPPLRRLISNESTTSETCASPSGEPIKKSAREFIIPIAVEGKGYVTPRQRSLEPETSSATRITRTPKPRRISSLVSGGESEEEDDSHMHRLRSTRAARAESVSSGEEDEEDEGFHLLTAENLFSTLLHRVRALTNRLNGEEGPGFQHPHSLFNNLHQSPFFNSPHLPRRHLFSQRHVESKRSVSETREGWGSRDLHADLESMFNTPRAPLPRGSSKKSDTGSRGPADADAEAEGSALSLSDLDLSSISLSERELRALSGLTPALTRRLQRQLLAHLPPAAARTLRRTLSLRAAAPPVAAAAAPPPAAPATAPATPTAPPVPQYCTLPRVRRDTDAAPPAPAPARSTPERPLLSKYLTPERAVSLDDSYSSDGGSAPSETSSGARRSVPAPAPAPAPVIPPAVVTEFPRKRISRFLRSDFYDTPPDESVYQKHKKEKELETQKILREIREKKNKALESGAGRGGAEAGGDRVDELMGPRKCLSPISPVALLASKERSRSGTPFFPMLDNIKESAADAAAAPPAPAPLAASPPDTYLTEESSNLDTKSLRPKSYPIKNVETFDEDGDRASVPKIVFKEKDVKEKTLALPRESKLVRPKSYPTSSPSPEKISLARPAKKDEITQNSAQKIDDIAENNNDVEVSFSITLPKKKTTIPTKLDTFRKSKSLDTEDTKVDYPTGPRTIPTHTVGPESTLVLKKYQVVNNIGNSNNTEQNKSHKIENGTAVTNGLAEENACKSMSNDNSISKGSSGAGQTVEIKNTNADAEEKKGTKKKVIKKVSSKSKADTGTSKETTESKGPVEKKKVTKKVKDKSVEDVTKLTTVTKKKSVLQSIGHKLEKLASNNKSSSPEKAVDSSVGDAKKDKVARAQREQSVPAGGVGGAGGVQRAATLADVAALAAPPGPPARTTVSKVLGLFKKFDPKDKVPKNTVEKSPSDNMQSTSLANGRVDLQPEPAPCPAPALDAPDADKPRRPTSLLLNGLGRRSKYGRTTSDSLPLPAADDDAATKNETKSRNLRNSLKLDFSRLPRVKKIVPTNPVIEPLIMSVESDEKDCERKSAEKNGSTELESPGRSRSRSRSTFSNSEMKSDTSAEIKFLGKNPLSPLDGTSHHPVRNHESTTPEKEDIIERIRRKSFYSRFNEKKQRRRSNLVGPGAVEYDPVARIHAAPPTPPADDLSPGTYSAASDLSPATDRYRALLSDLPAPASSAPVPPVRTALRYDTYGLNDKIDTYRSLDRNDFRKYSGARSYLDYDQPSSYTGLGHRYSRTRSLLDADGGPDEVGLSAYRDPLKYNRTLSMYSPGSYATYRPKRTLNSAIILKESEKEPSPENILEKIRNRKKISISVTRKPDLEKDPLPRSDVSPKGEGDGPKCIEKTD